MTEAATYYAIVDEKHDADRPAGLVRRRRLEKGYRDEALERDLEWRHTPLIVEWKHGEISFSLEEVTPDQAQQIIEHFRERWGGAL